MSGESGMELCIARDDYEYMNSLIKRFAIYRHIDNDIAAE